MTSRLAVCVLLLTLGFGTVILAALDMPVAPGAQAETFAKIFRFDRHLKTLGAVKVVVVMPNTPNPDTESAADEVRSAFGAAGIEATVVPLVDLSRDLGADSVVYVLSQEVARGILDAARESSALTISGDASLVESGMVAVGVEPRGGTTGIVINADRLADEAHAFAADLLELARIVRGRAVIPVVQEGDAGVIPPTLIEFDLPEYPRVARQLGVEGTVVIRVLVDESGQTVEVELARGILQKVGINATAMEAARNARFKPGTRDGVPVRAWTVLTIPFKL